MLNTHESFHFYSREFCITHCVSPILINTELVNLKLVFLVRLIQGFNWYLLFASQLLELESLFSRYEARWFVLNRIELHALLSIKIGLHINKWTNELICLIIIEVHDGRLELFKHEEMLLYRTPKYLPDITERYLTDKVLCVIV